MFHLRQHFSRSSYPCQLVSRPIVRPGARPGWPEKGWKRIIFVLEGFKLLLHRLGRSQCHNFPLLKMQGIVGSGLRNLAKTCSRWFKDQFYTMLFRTNFVFNYVTNLRHVQRRALRIIIPYMSYEDALSHLHLESLRDRRELLTKSFYRSVLKKDNKLNDLIPTVVNHTYSLRNPRNIPMFKSRTNRFKNSTIPYGVQKWDTVP
jgi:hypothetical protein